MWVCTLEHETVSGRRECTFRCDPAHSDVKCLESWGVQHSDALLEHSDALWFESQGVQHSDALLEYSDALWFRFQGVQHSDALLEYSDALWSRFQGVQHSDALRFRSYYTAHSDVPTCTLFYTLGCTSVHLKAEWIRFCWDAHSDAHLHTWMQSESGFVEMHTQMCICTLECEVNQVLLRCTLGCASAHSNVKRIRFCWDAHLDAHLHTLEGDVSGPRSSWQESSLGVLCL